MQIGKHLGPYILTKAFSCLNCCSVVIGLAVLWWLSLSVSLAWPCTDSKLWVHRFELIVAAEGRYNLGCEAFNPNYLYDIMR